jgi:hypothetical protein
VFIYKNSSSIALDQALGKWANLASYMLFVIEVLWNMAKLSFAY